MPVWHVHQYEVEALHRSLHSYTCQEGNALKSEARSTGCYPADFINI